MEQLYMNIAELFWDSEFDFLRFHAHNTGWGARYPGQGIFTPTLYFWQTFT